MCDAKVLDPSKPYWVDDLQRKHEAYWYGDNEAEGVVVEHEGRRLRILMPPYVPPMTLKVTAFSGDFLFLMGKTVDEEEEDGEPWRRGCCGR